MVGSTSMLSDPHRMSQTAELGRPRSTRSKGVRVDLLGVRTFETPEKSSLSAWKSVMMIFSRKDY